jgi:hypothetical protein
MVKCTTSKSGKLKAALQWKMPGASASASKLCCCVQGRDAACVVARERHDAASIARGPARSSAAGNVCRPSAFRPFEPAAAVLGAARHEAAGRLPARSRIRLGAASPKEGTCVDVMMPAPNAFQIFPENIGQEMTPGNSSCCS